MAAGVSANSWPCRVGSGGGGGQLGKERAGAAAATPRVCGIALGATWAPPSPQVRRMGCSVGRTVVVLEWGQRGRRRTACRDWRGKLGPAGCHTVGGEEGGRQGRPERRGATGAPPSQQVRRMGGSVGRNVVVLGWGQRRSSRRACRGGRGKLGPASCHTVGGEEGARQGGPERSGPTVRGEVGGRQWQVQRRGGTAGGEEGGRHWLRQRRHHTVGVEEGGRRLPLRRELTEGSKEGG